MALPFIKFFSFTVSYLTFIGMLVSSSIQFEQDESTRVKLSVQYNKYFSNYTSYIKNKQLTYRFPASDMYLRTDTANQIDTVICIWIIGIINNSLFK